MKKGFVYILSNYNRTTLYIGVTSKLDTRIAEHRNGTASQFTMRYKLVYLLYVEEFQSIQLAIAREKQLKRWHREWKFNLIRSVNPELKDLMAE